VYSRWAATAGGPLRRSAGRWRRVCWRAPAGAGRNISRALRLGVHRSLPAGAAGAAGWADGAPGGMAEGTAGGSPRCLAHPAPASPGGDRHDAREAAAGVASGKASQLLDAGDSSLKRVAQHAGFGKE